MQPPLRATQPGQWFGVAGLALPPKLRVSAPKMVFAPFHAGVGTPAGSGTRSAPPGAERRPQGARLEESPCQFLLSFGMRRAPGGVVARPYSSSSAPLPRAKPPGRGAARGYGTARSQRPQAQVSTKTKPPKFIKRTWSNARAGPGNLRSLLHEREISLLLQNPIKIERSRLAQPLQLAHAVPGT